DRERDTASLEGKGKHQSLAEKARREGRRQRRSRHHILQRHARISVETGSFVGEFARRQVNDLPKLHLRGGLQIALKLALRLVRQSYASPLSRVRQLEMPGPTKMLH